MASNVAIIQPLPGIGDVVWLLPHVRAISAWVGRPVTLICKPRSVADQLFAAESTVADVVWMDRNPDKGVGLHDGPAGLLRLVRTIRARRFDRIYVLHHSHTLAMVTWLAGIPERFGYGSAAQRPWLNRPPHLTPVQLRTNRFEQATAWLRAAGIPMTETEPRLDVLPEARASVARRLGWAPGSAVVLGIGGSEPYKQWPAPHFTALIRGLLGQGWQRCVLLGGAPQQAMADQIRAAVADPDIEIALSIGWPLTEVAALLADAAFYVGNDTSFLNMAAAVGIRSYGLFGATDPFYHSPLVIPLTPAGGRISRDDGMVRIAPDAVLEAIRSTA
jgi:heptosyltransferase-2